MSWTDYIPGFANSALWKTNDPTKKARKTLGQIPGETDPYFEPYNTAGKQALATGQNEYSKLINSPGGKLNEIGKDYHESPGLEFALNNAERAGSHAAAAGGMLGTPQHQYNAQEDAIGLANQDYYNWLNKSLGLYGTGIEGNQNLIRGGQQSGRDIASMIADVLGAESGYEYSGSAAKNQQRSAQIEQIAKLLGSLGIGV